MEAYTEVSIKVAGKRYFCDRFEFRVTLKIQ